MQKLNYKKTVLLNGLRIITVPMENTNTVTSVIFVKTGSRYEKKEENGLSHVLEHMFFKGTKKRPDKMSITRELDRIGAESNAYTSHDHMAYYIKAEAKYLDLSLDILSDMYLNSIFKPKAIEKERKVVVEEINMYLDNPSRQIWDNFLELIYPNHSLGWPTAGPKEIVLSLKRKQFIDSILKFYVARNTVVAVAGNINEKQTIEKIKKYFRNIKTGTQSDIIPFISRQSAPAIHFQYKDIDQAHLMIGATTYPVTNKRRYALDILNVILGGYQSSRLFMSVRDKLGLAYYVGSVADYFEDSGYFSAYAGINIKNINLGLKTILKEFQKVSKSIMPKKEIDDAKNHLEGALSLQLESSNNIAFGAGVPEITRNYIETPEEYLKNIKKVAAADIQAVARDIFKTHKLNLALIGPFKDKTRFEKILKNAKL